MGGTLGKLKLGAVLVLVTKVFQAKVSLGLLKGFGCCSGEAASRRARRALMLHRELLAQPYHQLGRYAEWLASRS
jgi:hypothetical protein